MKKYIAATLFLLFQLFSFHSAFSLAAPAGVSWKQAQSDVSRSWAQTYPHERILSIEQKGAPEYKHEYGGSETTTFGSSSFDWYDWSSSWIETTRTTEKPKGFFLRQLVLVTAERPNRTRARFTVAVVYKDNNRKWDFTEIATRADMVEELGGGAEVAPPPPAALASNLFLQAAQKKCVFDYVIKTASLMGEPSLGRSGKRFWYIYKVALEGTDRNSRPARCEVKDVAWLKWNADNTKWEVDSSFDCYARDCKLEE